jgi:hypothetical protein
MKKETRVLAILLLAVVAGLAFVHGRGARIDDYDELWHLATGKAIAESRSVPARDPFTFTAGETPWINTNWLAQWLIFEAWRAGGFEALALLGLALYLGALAATHAAVQGRVKSSVPEGSGGLPEIASLVVLAFVARALATASSIRPQGWTFLLLALAVLLVNELRRRRTWPPALGLGALLALSVQLHGGFIFVVGLLAFMAAGEAIDLLRRAEGASARTLLLLGFALGLGLLLGAAAHPQGVEALRHPFRYALDPDFRDMARDVQELRPPDFTSRSGKVLEVPLLAFILLALAFRPKLGTGEVLAFLGFLHLALTSARGLHYFAIVAAVPYALALEAALAAARERSRTLASLLDPGRILARHEPSVAGALAAAARWLPVALLVGFLAVLASEARSLAPGVPRSLDSPLLADQTDVAAIASFLRVTDPPGEVWNGMETGGALIWALGPERRVYADGRGDLHVRSGLWREMGSVLRGDPGWERILERRRCDTAVVDRDWPLAGRLLDHGWRVALVETTRYRGLVVFVRPGSEAEKKLLPR